MSRRNLVDKQFDPGQRFDGLFDSHFAAVHRYCARRLGPGDAEDAAADVFAIAWRRLGDLPEGEASRAWLFGVAYRVIGNRYRSRRRQLQLANRLASTQSTKGAGSDESEIRVGATALLLQALGELSPKDAELLRLSVWEELTRSEIAAVLGIKENAVDQRLHRARNRLRTRLDLLDPPTPHISPTEVST